jgi:integrase
MLKTLRRLFRLYNLVAYNPSLMLTLTDEVLAWEMWLVEQQGYDIHHSKNAGRWARRWVEHAGDNLTPASCVSWLSAMSMSRKLSPQTVRNRMSLCRQFAGWLVVQGRLQINPWVSIPAPRGRAGVGADALTQDEVNRLISAAESAARHPDGRIRNNANARAVLYRLLNGTGMRWGEWRHQRWDDIDLDRAELKVTKDKSRRRDTLPISESVVETLRAWRQVIAGEMVFIDYPTQKGLDRDMRTCKIEGRGKWHRMRVGFITSAFELGVAPDLIQKLVRHKSVDQTHRYLRHKSSTLKAGIEKISQFGKDSSSVGLDRQEEACSTASVFKPSTTTNAANECSHGGFGLEHLNPRGDSHLLQSDLGRAGGICNDSPIERLILQIGLLVSQIKDQNDKLQNSNAMDQASRGRRAFNDSLDRPGRRISERRFQGESATPRRNSDTAGDRNQVAGRDRQPRR